MDQHVLVAAARSWLGTPFQHQGRAKRTITQRGGCDCLGLLVGVAKELKLRSEDCGRLYSDFDETDYGHFPDGMRLQEVFERLFSSVDENSIIPGDVLLLEMDGAPRHVGIVSDYHAGGLGIIHALASARRVVEHRLDAQWQTRIVKAYRIAAA